jgi:hypothetical protein
MKNTDRYHARVKLFVAVTASALLMSAIASPAAADSVRWRTIVGVVDTSNTTAGTPPVTVPAVNVVGTILPGGVPWTTLGGYASVDLITGRVEFEVHGLVLAGGAGIGAVPAALTAVYGTVACVVGTPPITYAVNTASVPLSAQGDASFSGTVSITSITTNCNSSNVAFLITIPANGHWIANGAVRTSGP